MSDHETTSPARTGVTLPGGASAVAALHKVTEMKVRYIPVAKGHLKVYSRYVNGVPVMEAFTLASLAECLGMAPGTMEGRYARSRLYRWKLDIPTGESRPVRGFPLQLLKQVADILTTRGAVVHYTGNGEGVTSGQPIGDARAPLVYERYGGQQYITVAGLAEHYGRSITTIRSKLARAGLLGQAVNLHSPLQGGRPKRGWPVSMKSFLTDAIENGAQFRNEWEVAINRVQNPHTYQVEPQDDIDAQVEALSRQLPAGNPAPARGPDQSFVDLATELEGLLKKSKPLRGEAAPNPDTPKPIETAAPVAVPQEWVQRHRDAPVWEIDQVSEAMAAAGFSAQQVSAARREAGVEGA